ncbi:MAG: hypothetical protein FWE91_10030 [Defluviitaleaceae bacterium]|nr:hypothetical protein [Defluviitaleaceae bacterium]MCL2835811.1 hypothetical protein [Defluviitaleaceae bacterium]
MKKFTLMMLVMFVVIIFTPVFVHAGLSAEVRNMPGMIYDGDEVRLTLVFSKDKPDGDIYNLIIHRPEITSDRIDVRGLRTFNFETLDDDTLELEFTVLVFRDVPAGKIEFTIDYLYSLDPHDVNRQHKVQTIAIDVLNRYSGPVESSALSIQSGSSTLTAGHSSDAALVFMNIGNENIVGTTIVPGSSQGIIVSPTSNITAGNPLRPGQSRNIIIGLNGANLDKEAGGTINIPIDVTFTTESGAVGSVRTSIAVEINPGATPRPSPSPTPRPDVNREADLKMTGPNEYFTVRPGESVAVGITYKNDSRNNPAQNLTFAPEMMVGWRNEFVRSSNVLLSPGDERTFHFVINPLPGVSPGVYDVWFTYTYTCVNNKEYTGRGSVKIEVEEGPTHSPLLVIDEFYTDIDIVRPGDNFIAYANVVNLGDAVAEAVEVSVSSSGLGPRGITLTGSDTLILPNVLPGGYSPAGFTMKAHEDMASGTYPIEFNVKFGDGRSFKSTYYLTIAGETGAGIRGQLESVKLESSQGPFNAGDSAGIWYTFANTGIETARNIRVSLDIPTGLVPTSPNIQLFTEIVPEDAYEVVFHLSPTEESRTQTYLVGVITQYETGRRNADGTPVIESFTQYVGINVRRPGPTPTPAPGTGVSQARLTGFTENPEERLSAGESGTIFVTLINTGSRTATNVVVKGETPQVIVPVSAPAQTIPELRAGQSVTLEFSYMPTSEARTMTYEIGFAIDFETGINREDGVRVTSSIQQYGHIAVEGEPGTGAARARLQSVGLETAQGPFNAGDSAEITYTFTNRGGETAGNVRISLVIPPEMAAELVPTSPNVLLFPEIAPDDGHEITFLLSPTESSRTKTYLVGVNTLYETGRRNADGTPVTESFTQYVAINVVRPDSDLATGVSQARIIGFTDSPGENLGVGESGTIYLTLTNTGTRTASNIVVKGEAPSAIVPASAPAQTIQELRTGQSITLAFTYIPTSEARTMAYEIGFSVSFENGIILEDGTRGKGSIQQYGHIYSRGTGVFGPDGVDRSVPRLILSEYRITSTNEENPRVVLAGQEFDMFMRVQNTHPTKTVSNIIVSLTMPETTGTAQPVSNVFSPVSGSNSFYIASIEPGGEQEIDLRMFCLNNAQGRNYVMRILFEYEDSDGESHKGSQEVGITVRQPDKMELGPVNFPSFMSVGDMHFLSFYFRNTGYVTLRNLKITAEGEGFDGSGAVYIVGNFNMGGFDFYDGFIRALEPGEHTLRIVVTYDLDTGEHVVYTEEATVTVSEGFDFDMGFDMGMGDMGGRMMMGGMGGGMVVVDSGGRGGGRPGGGFDMGGGMDMFGFDEPAPEGFAASVVYWTKRGLNYANSRVWPWISVGGVIGLGLTFFFVRGVKMRRAYSLET